MSNYFVHPRNSLVKVIGLIVEKFSAVTFLSTLILTMENIALVLFLTCGKKSRGCMDFPGLATDR